MPVPCAVLSASGLIVQRLFISPQHNFFGHHGKPAGTSASVEVEQIECVAGRGIRGDRFFDHQENYKGQITFFSLDVLDALARELRVSADPAATRRNVFVRGIDLNELIGANFEIDGVQFQGVEECRPCYWMNTAIGPGAEAWMRGRGGLRARILTNGKIRRQ